MKKEFFVSGRTELAGNHTDHQNGRILAGALEMGIRAKAAANGQCTCIPRATAIWRSG